MLGLVDHGRVVVVAMRRHGVTVPRNVNPITFPRSPFEELTPVHHSLCVVIIVTTFNLQPSSSKPCPPSSASQQRQSTLKFD